MPIDPPPLFDSLPPKPKVPGRLRTNEDWLEQQPDLYQEIKDRIYEILKKMDVEKVWINPDCGLKTRGNAETWPSLENLVTAAKAVRAKLAK